MRKGSIDKGFFSYEPGSQCAMIHNDHLGTPQKMTDASGTVVWAADYKPFGEATVTVSTITNNLRFPGQYYDQESGLHYNYYRDYNPAIGRYVESDPLLSQFIYQGESVFVPPYLTMSPNRLHGYIYVGNNAVNLTDATGLLSCDGQWTQKGYTRLFNFVCRCFWLCIPCNNPVIWDGNWTKLPATTGNMLNSPEGQGAGARRGDACLCDKPGPDKDCKCKK